MNEQGFFGGCEVVPFILCSPSNKPDFHVRMKLYYTQTRDINTRRS